MCEITVTNSSLHGMLGGCGRKIQIELDSKAHISCFASMQEGVPRTQMDRFSSIIIIMTIKDMAFQVYTGSWQAKHGLVR